MTTPPDPKTWLRDAATCYHAAADQIDQLTRENTLLRDEVRLANRLLAAANRDIKDLEAKLDAAPAATRALAQELTA